MERYGRHCLAERATILPINRPFSNFQFLENHFPEVGPLGRVFSQARSHGAKALVIEELDPSEAKDLSEENADLAKLYNAPISSSVQRLSFFTEPFSRLLDLASLNDEHFIGYAVVKRDQTTANRCISSRIYESVIRPSRHDNNFIRGQQEWTCRVGGTVFRTSGYLYAQQNNKTNVCAHVACRTAAARFHQEGDMTYREMNDLPGLNIDHVDNKTRGLTSTQMTEILEAAGAQCVVGDYSQINSNPPPFPFQKLLYGSIESGYPAIICFATQGGEYHAVPVFGHTFNEDTWVPSAESSYFRVGEETAYLPSESWLSTFIAHDDNCGSNYCIPRDFLHARQHCSDWPEGPQPCVMDSECVACVIATLPKDVKVNPIAAEVIGADYLFSMLPQVGNLDGPWERRLALYMKHHLAVLRPILVDINAYVQHLKNVKDWDSRRIDSEMLASLASVPPRKVWMVELSVPELFSANRRKIGEVLINAEENPGSSRNFRNFMLARISGSFALYKGGSQEDPEYTVIPSGVQGHVPLFGCENLASVKE